MMSPLIREVSYDAEKQTLTIRFSVGCYLYTGVPPKVANDMIRAWEENHFSTLVYDATVEGKYKSTRIGS